MQEMTAMVVGYALILSVLLETMVILLIIPYVKPRVGKTFAYGILGSLLIFHDCFWSLFGESEWYLLFLLEMILFLSLVYLTCRYLCKGNIYRAFIRIFALEWIFQLAGLVISFPLVVVASGFHMEQVGLFLDVPSLSNVLYVFIFAVASYWIAAKVCKILDRHNGRKTDILLFIGCLMDITAPLLAGWRSICLGFPFVLIMMIVVFRLQDQDDKRLAEQFAYYQTLQEIRQQKEKEITEIRHDIANHLSIMEEMSREEEGRRVLDQIDKMHSVSFTGIPVLDCLIEEKEKECDRKGILFLKEGVSFREINVTEYELVSLFANLLSNAIEAAEQTDERKISLLTEKKQGYLKIELSNSKPVDQKPLRDGFRTTKKVQNSHGIGNRIIREIVEENGGRISYQDEGGKMVALVIIGG